MTSRKRTKHRAIPAKESRPVVSALDAVALVRETLVEERARLQGKEGDELTPTQRRMLLSSLVGYAERLGKITGETLQIPESKIVKLPAFRRVVGEMTAALAQYPEAAAALVATLQRLERGAAEGTGT